MRGTVAGLLVLCLTVSAHTVSADPSLPWDELRRQRESLEGTSQEVLESEQKELAELFQLNRSLQRIHDELKRLGQEVARAEAARTEAEEQGRRLKSQLETRRALFGARARFFYEKGNMGLVQVLLGSSNLGDFLSNVDIITLILRRDQELIRDIKSLRAKVDAQEAELAQIAAQLRSIRQQQERREKDLQIEIARKEERLSGLKERRASVESELGRLEEVWSNQALPVLSAFTSSFQTLSVGMRDIQPDALQVSLFPPSATVRLSEQNLNDFIGGSQELGGLGFRLAQGSVKVVGLFSGIQLEVTGTLEIVNRTVFRYRPTGIRFHGFPVPAAILEDLVQSGRLDIDVKELISPLSLLEVRVEDGYLFGKAGTN